MTDPGGLVSSDRGPYPGLHCCESEKLSERFGVCWLLPSDVELQGDQLFWVFRKKICMLPESRLLEDFISLDARGTAGLLEFARNWGVLLLCQHGLPTSHNLPLPESPETGHHCKPLGWNGEERSGNEPMEPWFLFSSEAGTILRASAQLHKKRIPREGDREILENGARRLKLAPAAGEEDRSGLPFFRTLIGQLLSEWLRIGGIRPRIIWNDDGASFKLVGGYNVFGAIALQLFNTALRGKGLVSCFECGRTFQPKRKPQAGRRIFCEICRVEGAPIKWASRDYRSRRSSDRDRCAR